MITSINSPVDAFYRDLAGGWDALANKVRELGCDGIEGIWSGSEIPEDFPEELMTGYHLTYFPEWFDFYRGNKDKVRAHFPDDASLTLAFGGTDPACILKRYREDLARALKTRPAYLVFHVSDVSDEECFTYRWLHTDVEVIDASVEIINELLKDVPPAFDFLVENQWWPGFRFTDPAMTERLLKGIRYERTGILLDTGHLMNNNRKIRNQKDGIRYILEMLDLHGFLAQSVKGIHFHQSLSGAYTCTHIGKLPEDCPKDYLGQFEKTYGHILQIDLHRPWTEPSCVKILDRVRPDYLTHEMAGGGSPRTFSLAKRQIRTIRSGYAALRTDEQD